MAGNGVVLKPSPLAALAGERIARVFARAGLPEGLLRIVHGHADTGAALVDAPRRPGALHRLARRRARRRRGLRARRQAQRARDWAAGTRCSSCADADARARGARRAVGGVRQRRASAAAASSARSSLREVARRVPRRRGRRARGAARRRPARARDRRRAARVARARLAASRELLDEAVADGATLHCGGPVEPPACRRVLRARRADRRARRRCASPARRCPGRCSPSRSSTPRTRRSPRPTRPTPGSAPRCGRPTATRARASPASCASAWCG